MSAKKTNLSSVVIISLFFLLFAGVPLFVFTKAYHVYSLKNLPVLTFEDIQSVENEKHLTGLLVLSPEAGIKSGEKLASYFVHPFVRRYRRFDTPVAPISVFGGKAILNISKFPDRFDYGPDLGALSFMVDGSKLENTLTRFEDKGWAGIIRKYKTTDSGFVFTDFTVIIDSFPGNRTMVTDTIFIETGTTDAIKPDFYSFDTANFSSARNYYIHKIIEKGLVAGDTIVGRFKILTEASVTISPEKIFCYGNPNQIWEAFFRDNKLFLLGSALLLLIPMLVLANLIRHTVRTFR